MGGCWPISLKIPLGKHAVAQIMVSWKIHACSFYIFVGTCLHVLYVLHDVCMCLR